MQRYVTRLRNIGIMGGIDAGSATCRERILELTSDPPTNRGERPASGTFGTDAGVPAQVGTWTPRSGPFADEATSVSIVEGRAHILDGALVVLVEGIAGRERKRDPLVCRPDGSPPMICPSRHVLWGRECSGPDCLRFAARGRKAAWNDMAFRPCERGMSNEVAGGRPLRPAGTGPGCW